MFVLKNKGRGISRFSNEPTALTGKIDSTNEILKIPPKRSVWRKADDVYQLKKLPFLIY